MGVISASARHPRAIIFLCCENSLKSFSPQLVMLVEEPGGLALSQHGRLFHRSAVVLSHLLPSLANAAEAFVDQIGALLAIV